MGIKIRETIFENRFMHVPGSWSEWEQDIQARRSYCLGQGKVSLLRAPVRATDLRASVSLVLAALATEGQSVISDIHHLDRGYADLDVKLEPVVLCFSGWIDNISGRSGS